MPSSPQQQDKFNRIDRERRLRRKHGTERIRAAAETMHATGQPALSPEYLQKLRATCLRLAQAHLPTSTPEQVVAEAGRRFQDCITFLTGGQS